MNKNSIQKNVVFSKGNLLYFLEILFIYNYKIEGDTNVWIFT